MGQIPGRLSGKRPRHPLGGRFDENPRLGTPARTARCPPVCLGEPWTILRHHSAPRAGRRPRWLAALVAVVAALFLAGGLAAPAQAAAATTTLTVSASDYSVSSGASVTVTGTLKRGSKAVSGAYVTLQKRTAGSSKWTTVKKTKTSSKGKVSAKVSKPDEEHGNPCGLLRNLQVQGLQELHQDGHGHPEGQHQQHLRHQADQGRNDLAQGHHDLRPGGQDRPAAEEVRQQLDEGLLRHGLHEEGVLPHDDGGQRRQGDVPRLRPGERLHQVRHERGEGVHGARVVCA